MRTNLRTIAREAGVHVATASRALRGLGCVNPQTRERVCAVARRLGYVRDPLLASALTFARRREKPVYRETMAFLAALPPSQYASLPWLAQIHAGAAERAAELGYGLECVRAPTQAREQRQLGRRMHSRGIRGCIVCPMSPIAEWESFSLDMDWSQFSGIEIGHALTAPKLPRIARNFADDISVMLEELHLRGYRRIGIAVSRSDEESRRWAMLAACLMFEEITPDVRMYPLFRDETDYDVDALERWISRRRPDVLLINGTGVLDWLRERDWEIPRRVGVCRIDCVEGCHETGLRTSYVEMGRTAVNQLASALERGGAHRPEDPSWRSVLGIPSAWHEGRTLRPRPA